MGRANALKWATFILAENASSVGEKPVPFRIIALRGGNAHNAVPSRARVDFAVPADKSEQFKKDMVDVFTALVAK